VYKRQPVDGVVDVTEVRSRGDLATEAFTELTVIVDGEITVERGHAIADEVERKLLDAGFTRAVVHVEPAADARPAAASETAG
jgi:divalent metal cation (Fe/Co/Zn/Cd) transporter